MTREVKRLRLAIVLVLIGVLSELIALLDLVPPTFLAFVFIGLPCMALGVLIYLVHVWRTLRRKDAL
jgi:hypothetical protein